MSEPTYESVREYVAAKQRGDTATTDAAGRGMNAWPEGVIARYVTVGGATVDITRNQNATDDYNCGLHCRGCGYRDGHHNRHNYAKSWAQRHAASCRAMLRPTSEERK